MLRLFAFVAASISLITLRPLMPLAEMIFSRMIDVSLPALLPFFHDVIITLCYAAADCFFAFHFC